MTVPYAVQKRYPRKKNFLKKEISSFCFATTLKAVIFFLDTNIFVKKKDLYFGQKSLKKINTCFWTAPPPLTHEP